MGKSFKNWFHLLCIFSYKCIHHTSHQSATQYKLQYSVRDFLENKFRREKLGFLNIEESNFNCVKLLAIESSYWLSIIFIIEREQSHLGRAKFTFPPDCVYDAIYM